MKSVWKHSQSVWFKWLVSFSLILIIPLAVFMVFMAQFTNILNSEIHSSNSMLLEQLQMQMDDILYDTKEMCSEIAIDNEIQQLADVTHPLSSYDLAQIVANLRQKSIVKKYDMNFYIYATKRDLVISDSTYGDSRFYYDTYLKLTGIDYDKWNKAIHSTSDGVTFTAFHSLDPHAGRDSKIVMIVPMALYRGGEVYANIVVELNQADYMKQSGLLQNLHSIIMVLNRDNRVLYCSTEKYKTAFPLNYSSFDPTDTRVMNNLSTGREIVSYIGSKEYSWKYIVIIPRKAYQAKITYTQGVMRLCLLLCLAIGGYAIFVLLRSNYKPISDLLATAGRCVNQPAKMPGNFKNVSEFQYLSGVIRSINDEKISAVHTMEDQKQKLRSHMILKLLENKEISDKLSLHELAQYNIEFVPGCFYVLVYSVRCYAHLFGSQDESLDNVEKYRLVCLILHNVTEELFSEQHIRVFYFHGAENLGFILNFSEGSGDRNRFTSIITEMVDKARVFVDANYEIRYAAACSGMQGSWENLPQAYRQAVKTLHYKETLDLDDILFYDDIQRYSKTNVPYYPTETERKISNAIQTGDGELACSLISDIVKQNLKNNLVPEVIQYLMIDILNTVIKAANQIAGKMQIEVPEISCQKILGRESAAGMVADIRQSVGQLCRVVSGKLAETGVSHANELYQNTIRFVNQNYMDESLNVGMLAQKFNVNIVYLSRIFTKYNGENLSEYINQIRLEHAKKMMVTPQTLQTISKAVGYCNLRTFMREFKKHEGVSPGKYKKIAE